MRKRLRKKYHLKEFTEYGFHVGFKFKYDDDAQRNARLEEFVAFVDSQGLIFGGGGVGDEWDGFVSGERTNAGEEQRAAVTQWLKQRDWVTAYAVSPLVDAWNAPLESYTQNLEYQTKP